MIGLLKWIVKQFAPYVAGILIGVGFFFLLVYLLPLLPEAPVLDWSLLTARKEVSVPVPPAQSGSAPEAGKAAGATDGVSRPPQGVAATQPTPPSQPTAPAQPMASAQPAPKFAEAGSVMSESPAQSDVVATEQPLDSELERDPVEIAISSAPPAKPAADKPQEGTWGDCGVPPARPGRLMDQYLACRWRADCLSRLDRARRMIEQDRKRCPTVGGEAQSCQAYYHSLEQQYHPSLCGGWPNFQRPGW